MNFSTRAHTLRRHFPLLSLIALFIALVLYFTFHNPIRVTTTPEATFGLSDTELKEYFLWKLYAYPNSPYVVCEFLKGSHVWQEDGGSFDTIMAVIDLEKGQRVLRTDWSCRHKPAFGGNFFWQYYRVGSIPVFDASGDCSLFLSERGFSTFTFAFPNGETKSKILTLDGRSNETNLKMEYLKTNPAYPTFLALEANRFIEYQWQRGKAVEIRQWESFSSQNFFRLNDSSFLSYSFNPAEWVFLFGSNPPTVRRISVQETLLSGESLMTNPHNARILTVNPDMPLLIQIPLNNGKVALFEIQTQFVKDGTPNQIFKRIGPDLPSYGEYASPNQDRLYFSSKESSELIYRLRTQNPNGSYGDLQDDIHRTTLPTKRRVFSEDQPYPDRMLYYADSALWTMNLDGTSEVKIFPKEDS